MRSERTKKLVTLAMLSALAYVVMVFLKIPVVLFLRYEPKDVIIAIGGFLYGPLSALAISVVVSLVEMVTVSETGIYGAIMNALSSCTFACTAALIYKKWRTLPGAAAGLAGGIVVTVPVMLLWNYLIVPLYLGQPRDVIATMLIPYFLPFNLLKYGLSAAITMLLYRPVRAALAKSQLLPASKSNGSKPQKKLNIGTVLISLFIVVTCVLLILSYQGII